MDNQELLVQIGQMIDRRFDDQDKQISQMIDKRFDEQEKRLVLMIDKRFNKQDKKWDKKFSEFTEEIISVVNDLYEQHSTQDRIWLENTVTKRIDSLFDGYQLTRDKQWEYERKIEAMLDEMERMELRIRVLENKSA